MSQLRDTCIGSCNRKSFRRTTGAFFHISDRCKIVNKSLPNLEYIYQKLFPVGHLITPLF